MEDGAMRIDRKPLKILADELRAWRYSFLSGRGGLRERGGAGGGRAGESCFLELSSLVHPTRSKGAAGAGSLRVGGTRKSATPSTMESRKTYRSNRLGDGTLSLGASPYRCSLRHLVDEVVSRVSYDLGLWAEMEKGGRISHIIFSLFAS